MNNTRFLLDANKWYPMDIAHGFWDVLAMKHRDGLVYTIDEVKREIKDAEISVWIADQNSAASFILNLGADAMT